MELLTWRNIQTENGTPMLQKKAGPAATDFVLYVEKPQSQRTKGRFTVTFKGAAWQQPDPGNWGHLYRWSEISGGSMD